jgi:phage-related minor tail protein
MQDDLKKVLAGCCLTALLASASVGTTVGGAKTGAGSTDDGNSTKPAPGGSG